MKKRLLSSWLRGLAEYVSGTEAPRQFWLWSGLSTIASALQRKVWIPYGLESIYPNLFVMIVGPPAARKAAPINFSRKILKELQITVLKDSMSRRDMSKSFAAAAEQEKYFDATEKVWVPQSAASVISRELSSLLAIDAKLIIEFLTDAYDCHDDWDYGIAGQGCDKLYYVCPNSLFATTPSWLSDNLPQFTVGTGFTSRINIVYGDQVYQRVPRPVLTEQQKSLYKALVNDLQIIHEFQGPFAWTKEAETYFDDWYMDIDSKIKEIKDERLAPYMGRIHVHILKVAMCFVADHTDQLILTPDEIGRAIELVSTTLKTAGEAFGGLGSSRTSSEVHRIRTQLRVLRQTTFGKLLSENLRIVNKSELTEVLSTLEAAGDIEQIVDAETGKHHIKWKGGKY